MKKFIVFTVLLMLFKFLPAQTAPDTTWTRMYGGGFFDWAWQVEQTTDGGYIVIADYSFGGMNYDAWLIKTDSQGNTSWTKTYGGDNYDVGHSVRQTTDGGYIITGYTYSYGAGSSDAWLIKTDANGNESWSQTFGGSNPEHGYSVIQTPDEGYTVVGYTKSFGAGDYDVWLIKTDIDGNEVWNKTYGGIDNDRAFSVQQTIDGEYIIAGFTESFGAGNYDMWLIKTLSNGDTLWTKTIGGEDLDRGRYVQQTTDKGYIVVGDTYIFEQGEYNVYIVKVNPETGVGFEDNSEPQLFDIYNYPNPFNELTVISYTLKVSGRVSLKIYDMTGQEILTLVNEKQTAGNHSIVWDSKDNSGNAVGSGIYFYQLHIDNKLISTKKMILNRARL